MSAKKYQVRVEVRAGALAAVSLVAVSVHVEPMFAGAQSGDVARDEHGAVGRKRLHEQDVTCDI